MDITPIYPSYKTFTLGGGCVTAGAGSGNLRGQPKGGGGYRPPEKGSAEKRTDRHPLFPYPLGYSYPFSIMYNYNILIMNTRGQIKSEFIGDSELGSHYVAHQRNYDEEIILPRGHYHPKK